MPLEVVPQAAQLVLPAGAGRLELVIPVLSCAESRVHQPQARFPSLRFERKFEGHWLRIAGEQSAGSVERLTMLGEEEAARRLPALDAHFASPVLAPLPE